MIHEHRYIFVTRRESVLVLYRDGWARIPLLGLVFTAEGDRRNLITRDKVREAIDKYSGKFLYCISAPPNQPIPKSRINWKARRVLKVGFALKQI